MRKALPHDTPVPQSKPCLWAFDTIARCCCAPASSPRREGGTARADPFRPGRGPGAMQVTGSNLLRHAAAAPGREGARPSPHAERRAHRYRGDGAYTL